MNWQEGDSTLVASSFHLRIITFNVVNQYMGSFLYNFNCVVGD